MSDLLTAINLTRNTRLTDAGHIAETFLPRLVGLLRHQKLDAGDGLWIHSCNSIHSIGMKFRFDAIFLDKNLKVVHLIPDMKPWRASKMIFSAVTVLELPSGVIAQSATEVGDQFEMRRTG